MKTACRQSCPWSDCFYEPSGKSRWVHVQECPQKLLPSLVYNRDVPALAKRISWQDPPTFFYELIATYLSLRHLLPIDCVAASWHRWSHESHLVALRAKRGFPGLDSFFAHRKREGVESITLLERFDVDPVLLSTFPRLSSFDTRGSLTTLYDFPDELMPNGEEEKGALHLAPFRALRKLTRLTSVTLDASGAVLWAVSQLPSLRALTLLDCLCVPRELYPRRFPHLQTLRMPVCVLDLLVSLVVACPVLAHLSICPPLAHEEECGVFDLQAVAPAAATLLTLHFGASSLRALQGVETLQHLRVLSLPNGGRIVSWQPLSFLAQLERLVIQPPWFQECDHIRHLSQLHDLMLTLPDDYSLALGAPGRVDLPSLRHLRIADIRCVLLVSLPSLLTLESADHVRGGSSPDFWQRLPLLQTLSICFTRLNTYLDRMYEEEALREIPLSLLLRLRTVNVCGGALFDVAPHGTDRFSESGNHLSTVPFQTDRSWLSLFHQHVAGDHYL